VSAFAASPPLRWPVRPVRLVRESVPPAQGVVRPPRAARPDAQADRRRADLLAQLEDVVLAGRASRTSAWHERRGERLREQLMTEFDAFTYDDLLAGGSHGVADEVVRAALEGQAVAVPFGAGVRFPGFQFQGGALATGVAEVVTAITASGLSGWPAALWFTAGNGWLAYARPVDVLSVDPHAVVDAARRRLDRTPE